VRSYHAIIHAMSYTNFDTKKATEVACFFLLLAKKGRKNVTKLRMAKWMYLSELESYKQLGEPIFNDDLYSMQHGPVPSHALELLENKKRKIDPIWSAVVSTTKDANSKHQYIILNATDCRYKSTNDLKYLSDAEIEVLGDVWKKYHALNSKELETLLHDQTKHPEWVYPQTKKSTPIDMLKLFGGLGYSNEASHGLWAHHKESNNLDKLLSHPA
jgi:uncharacterized phage-associated protein